jgi:hypothetical protein
MLSLRARENEMIAWRFRSCCLVPPQPMGPELGYSLRQNKRKTNTRGRRLPFEDCCFSINDFARPEIMVQMDSDSHRETGRIGPLRHRR